ncbi:MAG TPA: hypothetical protein VIG25_21035 [Pyrinomonadaceae bacterium]|jgi:hypothetical protein
MIWKLSKLFLQLMVVFSLAAVVAHGVRRTPANRAGALADSAVQQPPYSDYKGVRIGMTADEAHAKLGKGTLIDDQEFFVINDHETAQLLFDKANKVIGISVDYLGGIGAPDYRAVVGADIITRPDGSLYKMVRYEQLGFWVSYSRTATTPVLWYRLRFRKCLNDAERSTFSFSPSFSLGFLAVRCSEPFQRFIHTRELLI